MHAIRGTYYVVSDRSRRVYTLTPALHCTCPGYGRWLHCRHQAEVSRALAAGTTVDLARVPWGRREPL